MAREDVQIVLNSYEEEKAKQQRDMVERLNKAQLEIISGGLAKIEGVEVFPSNVNISG